LAGEKRRAGLDEEEEEKKEKKRKQLDREMSVP
jgi:hypothetical protein